eukprot:3761766-Rhodomonas_salina.1
MPGTGYKLSSTTATGAVVKVVGDSTTGTGGMAKVLGDCYAVSGTDLGLLLPGTPRTSSSTCSAAGR